MNTRAITCKAGDKAGSISKLVSALKVARAMHIALLLDRFYGYLAVKYWENMLVFFYVVSQQKQRITLTVASTSTYNKRSKGHYKRSALHWQKKRKRKYITFIIY